MDTVPTICIAFSSLLMLCYVHGLVEYQCAIPLVPGCVKLCDGQGVHYQSDRILQYHQRMVNWSYSDTIIYPAHLPHGAHVAHPAHVAHVAHGAHQS